MTDITRVPLQPIKKGSLTKLWLGVIVAILLGGGLAWAAAPKMLEVETLTEGSGRAPQMGDIVFVDYVGTLSDGTVFERSPASPFPPGVFPDGTPIVLEEGAFIPGFLNGLMRTRDGGKYRIEIPSDEAYGASPRAGSSIPPNSDLIFEVTVHGVLSREEAEGRMQQLQAMMGAMQQQQATEGAPAPVE
ncbi:FKBP-type peptidyl-prolyl cis-trans isomerase [Qipengyuania sp. 1NDH17]|uniref:Peptidyl-prolyl cis-trans isomerase n=1 Tax=Qipengyuania polymorpha TaxID=2867234 RepID=A0ABS7IYB0_9SPHN|nr:FKBP-type peptidyl-prolyl cis-trans isomerase [Qipengyuania polymorpha]MBX7458039.1 FKBP-type peptidyl-prolyl cis-trans isomerase [Qipengyuania polymorpha]